METPRVRKSRASTSEQARQYRQQGHDDALMFALAIGMNNDYENDHVAKKDVIDPSGDAHSVKSGKKKWQIFLYGLSRFQSDEFFQVMNGIGDILIRCIKSFPENYTEYVENKTYYKTNLETPMKELREKLQEKIRLKAFLGKSIFNGGEVNYLTVLQDGIYHVFWGKEVVDVLKDSFSVENSIARTEGQMSNQKVLFKFNGVNVGELEMRNDSETHYREIRFNMYKPKIMGLLFSKITEKKEFNNHVLVYGDAKRHFGRWINN